MSAPAKTRSDWAHARSRTSALAAELGRLKALLDDLPTLGKDLPRAGEIERLAPRLDTVFAKSLGPLGKEVSDLEQRIADAAPLNEVWATVESVARRIGPVSEELLLFVEGALARAAGLDGGLCAIVDRLLDDLARRTVPWERTAIPAPREQTSSRTWIVGVRIPDVTVWSLPLMAHELGHFALQRLEDHNNQQPGIHLLSGAWVDAAFPDAARARAARALFPHLHVVELFADVFATHVMGPAYVAAHAWRATPRRPWDSRGDHPAWGHRVAAALAALRHGGAWSWFAPMVEELWARDLAAAGEPARPPAGTEDLVKAFVDHAVAMLEVTAPTARFAAKDPVLAAGEALSRGAQPPDGLDVRTVINGAWVERVRRGWEEDDLLGDTAMAWYRRLVGLARPTNGATG